MDKKKKFHSKLNGERLNIVLKLEDLIVTECVDIESSIKWGNLVYSIDGKDFAYIAITKKHINLGFFNAASISDPDKILESTGKNLMHVKIEKFDEKKIHSIRSLIIQSYKSAKSLKLNNIEQLMKIEGEIKKNKTAFSKYLKLPPSHRREYIDYILEAKNQETRNLRMIYIIDKLIS